MVSCDVSQTLEGDEKPVHGKERGEEGQTSENCSQSVQICDHLFLIAMLVQSLNFKDPKCKFVLLPITFPCSSISDTRVDMKDSRLITCKLTFTTNIACHPLPP